jgi:hypothetical protein
LAASTASGAIQTGLRSYTGRFSFVHACATSAYTQEVTRNYRLVIINFAGCILLKFDKSRSSNWPGFIFV